MARSHAISIPRPTLGGGSTKVSGHHGGARYESRIPEIIAETPVRALALATALAEATAALAKESAPVGPTHDLRDSIEGKALPRGEDAAVFAIWYWFFVEFGTVHEGARPFMLPALETARTKVDELAAVAFANL